MHLNWYKKALKEQNHPELFRGDTTPISMDDYDNEYGTKQLGKERGSSFAGGPGIYFTTVEEFARDYGQHVTRKTIQNANILKEESRLFNYNQIEKILQGVERETMEIAISNWDENHNAGKKMLVQSIMNADNPIDQVMLIWSEVFQHQNPNAFIQLMINNGIDGIAIPRPHQNDTHYVIYNKNVLSN